MIDSAQEMAHCLTCFRWRGQTESLWVIVQVSGGPDQAEDEGHHPITRGADAHREPGRHSLGYHDPRERGKG